MQRTFAISALSLLIFIACTGQKPMPNSASATPTPDQKNKLEVTSTAFKEGEAIPRPYTCDGVNISPPLEWTGVPKTAKTIALIMDDPDAPAGTWVHWVLYNLLADGIGLIENTPAKENLAGGGMQGTTSFQEIGYGGPCPPSGRHRYFFKLYAVDSELTLKPGATKDELLKAIEGHVVAQGQLMGTYQR